MVSVELVRPSEGGAPSAVRIWMALHNSRTPRQETVRLALRSARDGSLLFAQDHTATLEPGEVRLLTCVDVSTHDPQAAALWVTLGDVVWHALLCEPKDLQTPLPNFGAVHQSGGVLLSADAPAVDVHVRPAGNSQGAGQFLNFPTPGAQLVALGSECTSVDVRWLNGMVTIPVIR